MSGQIARTGFRYQDLYLFIEVLNVVRDSYSDAWQSCSSDILAALNKLPFRFGIEANTRSVQFLNNQDGQPTLDWDVLIEDSNSLSLIEVKSGKIAKDDRKIFWLRLRRELAQQRASAKSFIPALVIDPDHCKNAEIWTKLATAAQNLETPVPSAPPARVNTPKQLLEEALYWLCSQDPAVGADIERSEVSHAIDVLSRFRLKSWRIEDLDQAVSKFLLAIFADGITDVIRHQMIGWVDDRATDPNRESHHFTPLEMFHEIDLLQRSLTTKPGQISKWRNLWNDLPKLVRGRVRQTLGLNGRSIPKEESQAAALSKIRSGTRDAIVLGPAGIGKSAFLCQISEEIRTQGNLLLFCGLGDLLPDELEDFEESVRFQVSLNSLQTSEHLVRLLVDGLDEVEEPTRSEIGQRLKRLGQIPHLRIILTLRDAVWNENPKIRGEFENWDQIILTEWDPQIVQQTLRGTRVEGRVTGNLSALLRTPILFDIFWRTFVEIETAELERLQSIETRHGLLASFWRECVVESKRHFQITRESQLLHKIWGLAASTLGPFAEGDLPKAAVDALLSESVLVKERLLNPRLQFRHPLFRDFALAQWCLAKEDPDAIIERWLGIRGDLKRWGCLRAMLEALTAPDSGREFPETHLQSLFGALLKSGQESARMLASTLGSLIPSPAIDPAHWSHDLVLPPWFGTELLTAARFNSNSLWSDHIANWPDDSMWCDDNYPHELVNYLEFLSASAATDISTKEAAITVSRKLRSLSQNSRYRILFDMNDWVRGRLISSIVAIDISDETFSWIEDQLNQPSWNVRWTILEKIVRLARHDPKRAAGLYRKSLLLVGEDSRPSIDHDSWNSIVKTVAIDWVLDGANNKISVLREYPIDFMPVALELAEALSVPYVQELDRSEAEIAARMASIIGPESGEESIQIATHPNNQPGLVDDRPDRFWKNEDSDDYHDALLAIKNTIEFLVDKTPDVFLSDILPILRISPLATIHSFLLDLALERAHEKSSGDIVCAELLDPRLFSVPGLVYWIEQGIRAIWESVDPQIRNAILVNLEQISGSTFVYPQLLCQIPPNDLTPAQQAIAETHKAHEFGATPQPIPDKRMAPYVQANAQEELRRHTEGWPEHVDASLLREFYGTANSLERTLPAEQLVALIRTAIYQAETLLAQLNGQYETFKDSLNLWFMRALTLILNKSRTVPETAGDEEDFPVGLVSRSAAVALKVVCDGPDATDRQFVSDEVDLIPVTPWVTAMSLADAALTFAPASENWELQDRFQAFLRTAFVELPPRLQYVISTRLRTWHWFRSQQRRVLHAQLFWNEASHGAVIGSSIHRLAHHKPPDHERILRQLLQRRDVQRPEKLVEPLAQMLASLSLQQDAEGRRFPASSLVRDILESRTEFGLLEQESVKTEFFRWFVFGLKNTAKTVANRRQPAEDFAIWCFESWMEVRRLKSGKKTPPQIISFTCYWLGRDQRKARSDTVVLKWWWHCIYQVLLKIINEGDPIDLGSIFDELKNQRFDDLVTPDQTFALVRQLLTRISDGLSKQILALDSTETDGQRHRSLREILENAVGAIDVLRVNGSLTRDSQKQEAYELLARLASEPFKSNQAKQILHMLHNE